MILFISDKQLERVLHIMSDFLNTFRAALDKVAAGNASDQETKDAVKVIQDQLAANTATDEEQSTAILELTEKLAASIPAGPVTTPEVPAPTEPTA